MMRRFLLASLGLLALTGALVLQAQEPSISGKNDQTNQVKDKLTLEEQILARRYSEFEQSLLKLKQRLEKSPNPEHRERAAILQKALDKAKDAGVGLRFEQLVQFLKDQKLSSINQIETAKKESLQLADDLRAILELLRQDTKTADLREKRMALDEMVKKLEELIRKEKAVRAQTELGKTDKAELKNAQNRVAESTAKLGKQMDGSKKGEGGEAKDSKGNAKDAGKGEGKKGQSKDAGKDGESKKGQSKEGSKDGKQGQAKGGDGKGGEKKEGKNAEAKGGGDKKGEGKQGEAKAGGDKKGGDKAGEAKAGDKKGGEPKQGEAKAGGDKKGGAPKAGEAKAGGDKKGGGEPKQGEAKAGSKGGDPKSGEAKGSKGGDPKKGEQAQPKDGGAKSQSKPAEAKSGDSKSGQGQSKGSGQPKEGEPSASKGDPNQKQQPQQPQDDFAKARKRIEESYGNQKDAEKKIDKGNNPEASEDQKKAIENLEAAKKKLEDLLRQIREEELERLLAALQARCERMLAMQIRVLDGTVAVHKVIDANADKKATRQNEQDSLKLSDDEKEIVVEATKAIEMLEAEGSAVAFPEVFTQVREDMKHVQRRLGTVDTGKVTQAIEEDIISTLKEMIEALKKAKQQLDQKKSPPSGGGASPPQTDQKLLDQIAELKMIRSMQIRVNDRTKLYGRQYEGQEQTSDAQLRRELHNLSERQERIFEVTNRIAKGDNR